MQKRAYKIVSNVPLPNANLPSGASHSGGRAPKYPLADMSVGDSFIVSEAETQSVRACIQTFRAKSPKREFVTKRIGDGTTRIWRAK